VPSPAHAVRLLVSLYRAAPVPPVIVGVGDDWRDHSLLREVDAPVIVRNPAADQSRLLRKVPTAYLTDAEGPAGWTEAILGCCPAGRA
jgi:predicted mannosyl-3-phosphoglycerate phosphatase (HAD superfamily)